jgi:stage V sporulation protein R
MMALTPGIVETATRAIVTQRGGIMDKEVRELEKALEQIWDIAVNKFGLDPFPTRFEIVPSTVMYEVGSYALPGRYSHWTFGKAYHKMKTMYDLGLSKIYEVVINSNPSYAFLLENNSLLQNKLVIAHVLGHVDFFKHNAYFSQTNRRMVDDAATHARRINEYEFKYGRKVVEQFLDAVLSIEEHIDPNFFIKKEREAKQAAEGEPKRSPEGRYDDLSSREELEAHLKTAAAVPAGMAPEKDLIWFILQHSPVLQPWQRDVMSMIHDEMLYFVPQMQTKIMNEGWACATGESLLPTEQGFMRFDELVDARQPLRVASGGLRELNWIRDFHREEQVPVIRIRTRRGFTLAGAHKHRVRLADGEWAYLHEVRAGDRVVLAQATNIWASEHAPLAAVAAGAGASGSTAFTTTAHTAAFNQLDEAGAWLLGCVVGNAALTKSGIELPTEDDGLAERLSRDIRQRFGIQARRECEEAGGRNCRRIVANAPEFQRFFESVGINPETPAEQRTVPSPILRSPKSVVSAFLRGCFDADGDAGPDGIRLSSASPDLLRIVQILLLNSGILSTQREHRDGFRQLEIAGASAARFLEEIGFSVARKDRAMREYARNQGDIPEDPADEIVSIEQDRADVFDITVDEKHAYVANGFVNHNSFWHSRIMREMDLPDQDHLEFAELHAGVVSPHRNQLNPYYLGYKILEDIERRWDNPTKEEQERFGRKPGEGRAKIFDVRELDNDVSFLRNYLTEELCEELDLFVFELVDDEDWTVMQKQWERVRDQLVSNMTNFGFPYIEVTDGDYNRNMELYLRHRFEGAELDVAYAKKVLENVHQLWGRPVHLETVVEEEATVLHFDGEMHSES